MYLKLTLKNMKRSLKNYMIYFVTIIVVITLMHGFLSLAFSPDIMGLSDNMVLFKRSVIVITLIASFLISYVVGNAADFIINQRKKEFAIYYLLGMEKKYINRLFYIENTILYFLAMVFGILLGKVLSGFLSKVILKIFDIPHNYSVSTSLSPVIFTVVLCVLMQLITVARIISAIKKKHIVDLLYDSIKNEPCKTKRNYKFVFILSIVIVVISVGIFKYAITCNSIFAWWYMAIALIFLMFGIYRLYRTFPIVFALYTGMLKKWNYKGTNIFLSRQIISRTNSTGRLMAIVAICLTLAMSTMAMGLTVGAGYKSQVERYAPYDIAIKVDTNISDFDMELDHIKESVKIKDIVNYKIYGINKYPELPILALSDYNKIRKQLELPSVNINENEYIIHCEWSLKPQFEEKLKKNQSEIKIGNYIMYPSNGGIHTEVMEQRWMVGENGYAIIVSDGVIPVLNAEKSRLIVTAENSVPKEIKKELFAIVSKHLNPYIMAGEIPRQTTIGVLVQSWTKAHSLTGYTALSFCSIYMGIIFITLVCTLLGFQQLAVAEKNKKKYSTLWKMGVSLKTIHSLIIKEMLIIFSVPLLMPLFVTMMLMMILNDIYMDQMAQANLIPCYFSLAIGFFVLIYAIYFVITFSVYRNAVLLERSKKS